MSMSSGPVDGDVVASHSSQNVKVEEVLQESDPLKTVPSTTPPSSPPVLQKAMESQSQEMPPPVAPASKTRKRSRGESVDAAITVPDSSASAVDDIDSLASQDMEEDTTTDTAATVMQNQRLARSSRPASPSAQSAETSLRQHATARTGKPTTTAAPPKQAQQEPGSDEREPGSDMTTISNDPGLPEDQLESYDWSGLEHRYHLKCAELHNREQEIFNDLNQLISVMFPYQTSFSHASNICLVFRGVGRRGRSQGV